ncbi:MAG: hypothetical protein FWG68_04480 [Defluviitaleaceae bacterium]|nr:hypothetical protein [Defluviitaleaceae bacterium]
MKKFCIIAIIAAFATACGVSQNAENSAELAESIATIEIIEPIKQIEPIKTIETINPINSIEQSQEQTSLLSHSEISQNARLLNPPPNMEIFDIVSPSNNIFAWDLGDTTDRGFQIDNFNIYDNSGNLLIETTNYVFSPFGTISPNFYVIYGGFPVEDTIGTKITETTSGKYPNEITWEFWDVDGGIDFANGVWHFPEEDGTVQLPWTDDNFIGGQIPITPEKSRLRIGILESDIPYFDFVITSVVYGREVARLVGLPAGHVNYVDVEFEPNSMSVFRVIPIARGGSGFARILVQTVE